ncbi:MAG: phage holin family protein [Oscillospiraceae bacterium]|nr:phage holin family protein [Oscillospiraceae bacterium]
MDFGIASVAVITAIVYIIGLIVKATKLQNKWIPVICGISGIGLGVLALVTGMPDFPAADYLTAAAVGGVSGLAATGIDQTVKQLKSN